LQELGPIFVKFGQILSTRRDLVPPDIAVELTLLQDRVAPFDGNTARALVEAALGQPIDVAFASFDTTPLASASIAQVHAATLHAHGGRRRAKSWSRSCAPNIEKQIAADISLLKSDRRAGRSHASIRRQDPPARDRRRDREHARRRTRPAARSRQRFGAAPLLEVPATCTCPNRSGRTPRNAR
jgi:predicted unusual protein kinase regulating ubiquinone biosynthesis (AarF/ABC1/UbiB family)